MKNKKTIQTAMEKYYKILNQIITESFPTLKNQEIKIIEDKKILLSADAKKFNNYLRLRLNYDIRDYSNELVKGLFSHELSHFEYFLILNKLNFFIYEIKYNFSKQYRKKIERETDINAIKKGYARELYAQRKLKWDLKDRKIEKLKKNYLSPEEIKKISIKLKKW